MPPDVRVQMIADGEIDILIIDGLRPHEHNLSHLSIDEAVVQARLLKPRKTYIIGMSHESDYHKTNAKLRKLKDAQVDPIDVELCFDGLKFPLPE
jgi:phosphoribosyl 1,2-cyclic phosphodiesterase